MRLAVGVDGLDQRLQERVASAQNASNASGVRARRGFSSLRARRGVVRWKNECAITAPLALRSIAVIRHLRFQRVHFCLHVKDPRFEFSEGLEQFHGGVNEHFYPDRRGFTLPEFAQRFDTRPEAFCLAGHGVDPIPRALDGACELVQRVPQRGRQVRAWFARSDAVLLCCSDLPVGARGHAPSAAASVPLGEGTSRPSQVDPHPRPDPQGPWSQRVPGVKAVLHIGRCVLVRPGGLDADATARHHGPGRRRHGGWEPCTRRAVPHLPTPGRWHERHRRRIEADLAEMAGDGCLRAWTRRSWQQGSRGDAPSARALSPHRVTHGSLMRIVLSSWAYTIQRGKAV